MRVLLVLLFLCTSCVSYNPGYRSDDPLVQRGLKIVERHDIALFRQGFLQPLIIGGYQRRIGYFDKYYLNRSLRMNNVEEARMFFCKFIDDFLKPLNADEQIKPCCTRFPLTWDNVDMVVRFSQGNPPSPISQVRKRGHTITYYREDEQLNKEVPVYEESIEEAYRIYQEQLALQSNKSNKFV